MNLNLRMRSSVLQSEGNKTLGLPRSPPKLKKSTLPHPVTIFPSHSPTRRALKMTATSNLSTTTRKTTNVRFNISRSQKTTK